MHLDRASRVPTGIVALVIVANGDAGRRLDAQAPLAARQFVEREPSGRRR